MSRTKKGSKAPGREYWSARPFNKYGGTISRANKKRTHKAERIINKKSATEIV